MAANKKTTVSERSLTVFVPTTVLTEALLMILKERGLVTKEEILKALDALAPTVNPQGKKAIEEARGRVGIIFGG
ncbi:MAG: hypothetical protein WCE23_09545 [Candidatus Binatus sp.]|uniref:hypothetical protein n=1 Tax=Candidatus Binatus sp. TaxID=2811406 RepID=UPI003C772896